MSWEEHERLVRELGIPAADRNSPALRGIFGTTFLPGRFHISISTEPEPSFTEERRAMRTRVAQLAERGEELSEGPYGLDTDPPFENGTPLPRITRHGPVSIRRRWNGSMVISRRGFASQPVDAARGKHAVMRVHRGNPRSGHDEVDEADCVCLTTEPFPRWLVEDEAAEMLEMALRHTNEIIEFGMWGASGALTHVTWLRGCAGGRGRALWPTNSPARATHVCSGISINMMSAGVAEEVRRELVEINQVFGLDVPRRHHGDLDPASAWELLRASMRAG